MRTITTTLSLSALAVQLTVVVAEEISVSPVMKAQCYRTKTVEHVAMITQHLLMEFAKELVVLMAHIQIQQASAWIAAKRTVRNALKHVKARALRRCVSFPAMNACLE